MRNLIRSIRKQLIPCAIIPRRKWPRIEVDIFQKEKHRWLTSIGRNVLSTSSHGNANKTTVRLHLLPISMAVIRKKKKHNKCWQGCGQMGTLQISTAIMENKMEAPPENEKLICHMVQLLHFWEYTQRKRHQHKKDTAAAPRSLQPSQQQRYDTDTVICQCTNADGKCAASPPVPQASSNHSPFQS